MTKDDLIKNIKIKTDANLSRATIDMILNALKDVVYDAMKNGEEVSIAGLGKFSVRTVPEKSGIVTLGAAKGERWHKPEHKKPTFKLYDNFKKLLDVD